MRHGGRTIETRSIAATGKRGRRIVADAGMGVKITVPYPTVLDGIDAHFAAVEALLQKMRWSGRWICGSVKNGNYVFVYVRNNNFIDVHDADGGGK